MAVDFFVVPGEELDNVLRRASAYLAMAGIDSARVDAELLAAHCWGREVGGEVSRGRLQALGLTGQRLPATCAAEYEQAIKTRARRVPLQHITGIAYFRHLQLFVGPGVFIPRPETELLVSRVLEEVDSLSTTLRRQKIADLCTGSGAIAAAISHERSSTEVTAVELSKYAHAWAKRNLWGTGVRLVLADATGALTGEEGSFDIVAANPPYIPSGAIPKEPEVRDHDPKMALFGGGEDGLKIPRALVYRAYDLLKPTGFLIMEHAETQGESMRTILASCGFEAIESIDDLTGRARHTAGYKPASASDS